MITQELMGSEQWAKMVSNNIELTLDVNNKEKSLWDIYEAVQTHYVNDGDFNTNYLGKLLVARSNIKLLGGGDLEYLQVSPMAHLDLMWGELAEINTQLDCISLFEITNRELIEPNTVPENLRDMVFQAAEQTDKHVDETFQEEGIFTTVEEIVDLYFIYLTVIILTNK